jgi:hypothetical protein
MTRLKFITSLGLMFVLSACSAGGSLTGDPGISEPTAENAISTDGPSEEGKAFIIEACSPFFNFDWSKASPASNVRLEREFNQIKDTATLFDDTTKKIMDSLVPHAAKLTETSEQWRTEMPATNVENPLEKAHMATENFLENTNAIGQDIDEICDPFFE